MTTKTTPLVDARREQAEGRLRIIRNALGVADEELEAALVNRDWEVFDLPSFEAYCAEKIPEFRHFKMRREPRNERIDRLHRQGATIPQIVAATGSSLGTVHRRLEALEGGHKREPVSNRKEADPAPPALAEPKWLVVARFVNAQGQRGASCLEFERAQGWGHGAASAAFYAAEKKQAVRRDGRIRQGYGVYRAS